MKTNPVYTVTDKVKWIGIPDYDIVTFDVVMETKNGTTYNSYFIDSARKTIIDTAKEKFLEQYIDKIRQVADPAEIEYIVVNHTEPDHSGCLKELIRLAPKATVVGSGNAMRYLNDIMHTPFRQLVVKDGQKLDLGNDSLQFISAPNLHWPDTIYTYLEGDKVLFTCDSFGCHYCSEQVFDDQSGDFMEAFNYYFDVILKPYSKFLLKAIEKIKPLDINIICPGHGPILRSHWKKYVKISEDHAREYLSQTSQNFIYIPYVSAYDKTGVIASKIAEGIRMAGTFDIEIKDIEKTPLGEIDASLTRSSAIIVGSPVINQNILLPVYRLFALINPLRDRGKLAGSFGSYGWSGENIQMIRSNLENLKLKHFGDGIFVKFTPSEPELEKCVEYGKAFGEEFLKLKNTEDFN